MRDALISEAAEEFGTPLYLYDADVLRGTYRRLRRLLHPRVDVFYSLKANPNVSVSALLRAEGAGAEVCSPAELRTALDAGVAPDDIIYLGPAKDAPQLRACVRAGIHAVVCESLGELALLERIADEAGRTVNAMLRINPAQRAPGSALTMGGKPRQFGIDESEVAEAGGFLRGLRRVHVMGLHAYLGSRFLDHEAIIRNTREVLRLADELAAVLGRPLETVDFGGGFGVAYFDNESDLDEEALTAGLAEAVGPYAAAHPECRLITELGRYLVADAGLYVIRAVSVKDSLGETFVVCDGGTNHHMHAVGIGQLVKRNFPVRLLSPHEDDAPRHLYTVTGPLCTPTDLLAKKISLPRVRPGNLLAIERSGAYGPTASPVHFLGFGAPAEVMVLDGRPQLVRFRDTVEDLLSRQRLVEPVPTPTTTPTTGEIMRRTEIIEALRSSIGAVTGRQDVDLTEDTRLFDDLDLDSTSMLELLVEIEEALDVQVDPDELAVVDLQTVGTLTDLFARRSQTPAATC
ncbi:phosphopantetheine-binding protein [Streptomyces anulatus]|uniref:phosphopantetheine-binding protein n=1 Tax=Streptomyces anulatus TaxID=1892 RepID=UPI001C267286|nr:phosphopantetheine-binding protein [Streptomyces anulatus]